MDKTKVCAKCGKELDLSMFNKNKSSADGLRSTCKECDAEYRKEYARKNPEMMKAIKQRYRSKEENREIERKSCREYNKKNREKVYEYKKKYMKGKPRNSKIYMQIRRAKEKELESNFRKKDWKRCLQYFDNKCAYCGSSIGLEQEHFIPVSKGGEYTINNIIPACKKCNISKKDNDFEDWYKNQDFYSKEREEKIYKYMNYKDGVQQLRLIV